MKQVNVLMEPDLLEHLENLSTIISLIANKKITVSDVVRRAVSQYSSYGDVKFVNEFKDNKIQIQIESENDSAQLLTDRLKEEKW